MFMSRHIVTHVTGVALSSDDVRVLIEAFHVNKSVRMLGLRCELDGMTIVVNTHAT